MAKDDEKRLKQIRKLRDSAARLVEKGKHQKALAKYLELEQLDPQDASWSKRVADCHRRLGQRQHELSALIRAADGYSRTGFLLKAVAMCKLVLAIDPNHTETLERLAKLHADQTTGLDRMQRSPGLAYPPEASAGGAQALAQTAPAASAPAESPPPAPSAERRAARSAVPERARPGAAAPPPPTGGMHSPLESLDLNRVVDSRLRPKLPAHSSGIYELNLDELEVVDPSSERVEVADASLQAEASAERARETASQLLPHTPLFSEVSEDGLLRLISRVRLRELAPGDPVFEQGEPAEALFVIAEGSVEIIEAGPPRRVCERLGEGQFFGEIGLISDSPRRRSVFAVERTQLLVVDRSVVSELREAEPGFLTVLLRFLRCRLIAPLLRTSPLFATFSDEDKRAMTREFQFLELEAGAVLIEEGKRADGLFVLLSGEAEVIRKAGERLAVLQAGDVFGEMSLLTQQPAVATVRTTKKAFALEMPADRFTQTVMVHPQVLMYVSELADERRRQNEALADERLQFS